MMIRGSASWLVIAALSMAVGIGCKGKTDEAPTQPSAVAAPPPTAVPAAAAPAPQPTASVVVAAKPEAEQFAVGNKITIEWKGKGWPGVITEVVAKDRYRIHYDGYGKEWDEIIGPKRILGRR